ncbi:MAG: glycosyltransferase family 1 protein [bacterium]|nr:glycosyltransferase family 1 protein [bacterium]
MKRQKINRIGIDARFYGPVGKGLGRYTQEIVDNIIKLDRKNEYVVFLRRENFHSFNSNNPKVKKVLADIKWYGLAEQILLPFYIWRERLSLMHFSHFNVPVFCPVKFVVTIHDLILIKFPTRRATTLAPMIYKIKNFFYKIVITLAVKRARKVIAVSEYTKLDLVRQFKIKPEKVRAVYEGASEFSHCCGARDEKADDILNKYGITKPYLLYVGNAYPHKNLEGLIRVFSEIIKNKPDLKLVLVGKEDYFYSRLKQSAINQVGAVIFPGYVPDEDLRVLYAKARAYVFPSLYEGFGLPALEAMAFGLPVASSNKTCLPEILGEAAVYFNPENEAEMKEKIELVVKDENLRQELIKRGYEQVKKYRWIECAQKTLAVYNEALNKL